jgi:hypothetical protein
LDLGGKYFRPILEELTDFWSVNKSAVHDESTIADLVMMAEVLEEWLREKSLRRRPLTRWWPLCRGDAKGRATMRGIASIMEYSNLIQ